MSVTRWTTRIRAVKGIIFVRIVAREIFLLLCIVKIDILASSYLILIYRDNCIANIFIVHELNVCVTNNAFYPSPSSSICSV